jgi:hypothetical protein
MISLPAAVTTAALMLMSLSVARAQELAPGCPADLSGVDASFEET